MHDGLRPSNSILEIKSSFIQAIALNSYGNLYVQIASQWYVYNDVPLKMAVELAQAESPGQYFNKYIRNDGRCYGPYTNHDFVEWDSLYDWYQALPDTEKEYYESDAYMEYSQGYFYPHFYDLDTTLDELEESEA